MKGNPGVLRKPMADRLWPKVEKIPGAGCWIYMGKAQKRIDGSEPYGLVRRPFSGGYVYAHRLAWELTSGSIPAGVEVCHRCDVRLCVNPDHLFLGTQADNLRDAARKGRMGNHVKKLTPEKVAIIKRDLARGRAVSEIAREYGVFTYAIYSIRDGGAYAYVEAQA